VGDDLCGAHELAGTVRQEDAKLLISGCRCETVTDHALQKDRVNVSSREHEACLTNCLNFSCEDGGHGRCSCWFDDKFRAFEEHEDRSCDVVVSDGDDL